MISGLSNEDFSENQIRILRLLFEKEYLQNKLQERLETSAANLHYHLSRLEIKHLIKKETIQQIGNAKINKISLNPTARQLVREILGLNIKDYTLITGFGVLKDGYLIPDKSYNKLIKSHFPVSRVVCFTSSDAKKKRENKKKTEDLIKIDQYIEYDYFEYRYLGSSFFNKVEEIISIEIHNSNVIIDLTPLSKLYSFKMLEISNIYHLPCFYLGNNENNEDLIYFLTDMNIKGKPDPLVGV